MNMISLGKNPFTFISGPWMETLHIALDVHFLPLAPKTVQQGMELAATSMIGL